jgi:DeoR/GlpR family transcriptional regulator of sugar metabolism
MLTQQRKSHILEVLRRDGQVVAKKLSAALSLSEDTIRRDLRELAQEGLLQRVHGGALPSSPALADFSRRQRVVPDEKVAIGRAAAALVQPGQVVFIDGGTTAVQMARHLDPQLRATVVTHSPSVAVELVPHAGVEVVMIGGRLFKHSIVSVGAGAVEEIKRIRADIYFMGVTGIHPKAGLSTGDLEEANIKRALMAASAETVVLASSEKLGGASAYVIAQISDVSTLVVADKVPNATLKPYKKGGIAIVRAATRK